MKANSFGLSARDVAVFGLLGALMYASKVLMELLPNVHLLGVFVVALTVVYRKHALFPIYTYVLINGVFAGFALWWIPYLYVWTLLWGAVMLLPRRLPKKWERLIYMAVCGLHGCLFGILYAPAQAVMFGLSGKALAAWIMAGLPWDAVHGLSNFALGALIPSLISLLKRLDYRTPKA